MGMRNIYKRDDIFVCRNQAHGRFGHRVSAYHVLKEKGCYPDGCLSFLWKCKLLGKGGACPKGYRHVGSNCTQCRHYDEEKVHRRPEALVSEREFEEFREECRSFDDWVASVSTRPIAIGGTITDVRPHVVKRIDGPRSSLSLQGFLLRLLPAFVGLQGFDDPIFLSITRAQQRAQRLAPGDRIEVEAWVRLDRGRIVGQGARSWQIDERGGGKPADWEQALIDRLGAVPLADQPDRCLRCERGVLVDIESVDAQAGVRAGRAGLHAAGQNHAGVRAATREGRAAGQNHAGKTRGFSMVRRRELYCLEGIGRPKDCPYSHFQASASGGETDADGDREGNRAWPSA